MADHQDGDLIVKILEQPEEVRLPLGVDAGRGFVQQQQPGPGNQGPRDENPLALAAGKLPYFFVRQMAHLQALQGFHGLPAVGGGIPPPAFAGTELAHQDHIQGGDGEIAVDVHVLGHIPDDGRGFAGGLSTDAHQAAVGLQQAEDHLEQGCLAAAVGTDHGDEIAFADGQAHVLEHGLAVIGEIYIGKLDNGCFHNAYLNAASNLSAAWRRLAIQSSARGSAKTTCPPMALAIRSALFTEN